MDPSRDEGLRSLLSSLVDSASSARLCFLKGSINECLYSLQETRKTAEHLEYQLFSPGQDRLHTDPRSGSHTEPSPVEYQRHGHAGIQEPGRGSAFPYPQLSHRQQQQSSSSHRGPPSPAHMLGPGHGPGAGVSTHLMQQSQRYPGSGPGPDSGSHYREQQQQQQHGSLSPSHMGPPPRSFHADQQGSMSMSMTMSMAGDEAMSPQDRSRSALYPTQGPGSETTTSTTSSAGMGSQQQPGQFPGHHRGSTGTMSDPLQPMHHRQRQNSLPHVLEHHSQFIANSPHYLHPLSDGFVSPSSSGGGSAVGGVRPISPNSAQQQSPLRSQYAYQGNGNTGSSSNGGSSGDTRVAEYIPEQEHRQKNMHHHQHHQQQQNQHQHHQQQHHPHHQQHHQHQLQHRHQHYDPAHPHTFQPPPPRIERHGQEPSTPLSSFQPSRTSVQPQHRGSAGHSGKTTSLLHVEDSQKKNMASAPGGANSGKGGDVKMMMTHTSGSRSGSGPTSEPRPMTTISGTGTSSGGRAQSSGNIHAPSMAGLSMSGPSSTSSSSPTVGGGPQAMVPSSGSGSIGGGGTVGAGGGGGLKSGRGEGSLGARTQFHAPLEPEVIARLDELFFKFLQRLCSELNACDSRGDQIHQPLMAKKMQRLEASTDFRPFKFRIQAFTNAFHESLVQHSLSEDILPLRKVKVYLWKHKYISRFNEDGKKQKSKGNHVWNIEARRITDKSSSSSTAMVGTGSSLVTMLDGGSTNWVLDPPIRWEFREYTSRIAGQIMKFARVGVPYIYAPRIWDAQMSCPTAEFSSPWLPPWLKWYKSELRGIPGPDDKSCTIVVVAEYLREGENCHLELSFPLTVSDPEKEGELMDSPNEDEEEQDQDQDDDDDESSNGEYDDEEDETSEFNQHPESWDARMRGAFRKQGRERRTVARAKESQENKRRKQR